MSYTVTVVETLTGATNSPRSSTLTITVPGSTSTGPLGIIFDSDMSEDHDDLAAFGVAYGLHKAGECEIIAALNTSRVAAGSPALRGLLNYSGLNGVPVGQYMGTSLQTGSSWAQTVADMLGRAGETRAAYSINIGIARRALFNRPTNNNAWIVLGGQTALREFLESPSNYNGDGIMMTGLQLADAKLKYVVSMMGGFSSISYEYNTARDPAAATYNAANCPVPMYYCGKQQTETTFTGPELTDDPLVNPYRAGFDVADQPVNSEGKRAAFDPMTVLAAVRITSTDYTWNRGTINIGPDPANPAGNTFTLSSTGNHYWMAKNVANTVLNDKMDALVAQAFIPPYAVAAPVITGDTKTATTITLAFSEVTGACGYEYQLNGGAWAALALNKTITGLTGATTYAVRIRGKRPGMAGAQSAVRNVTTA